MRTCSTEYGKWEEDRIWNGCGVELHLTAPICTDRNQRNEMQVLAPAIPGGTTVGGTYFSLMLFCIFQIVSNEHILLLDSQEKHIVKNKCVLHSTWETWWYYGNEAQAKVPYSQKGVGVAVGQKTCWQFVTRENAAFSPTPKTGKLETGF